MPPRPPHPSVAATIAAAALLLTLTFALSACPDERDAPSHGPALAANQPWRRIINGTPATEARYDAAVQLAYRGHGICSGTLITDDVVLTAAHCVYVKDCVYDPVTWDSHDCQLETDLSQFRVYVRQSEDADGGQVREVIEVHAHADYDANFADPALSVGGPPNDIALLKLAAPFRDVTPIPALPDAAGLAWTLADEGAKITYVGFGLTETGTSGERLRVAETVTHVCLGDEECGSIAMPKMICARLVDGMICSGDSGGPMLIERDGVTYVGAVSSYGDKGCKSFGCSTAVSAYADWIAEFLGGDGLANGDGCIDADQCLSGVCSLGVCCDRACTGAPCEACSRYRSRAGAHGTCGDTTAGCDDGDLCTLGDRCAGGSCRPGYDKFCPSADQCNAASVCDPATGECAARVPKSADTACDDRNACTLDDHCLLGSCVGAGTVYCAPRDCQQLLGGGYYPNTGTCAYENLPDGAACGGEGSRAKCRSGACEKPSSSGGCGATGSGAAGGPIVLWMMALGALLRRAGSAPSRR